MSTFKRSWAKVGEETTEPALKTLKTPPATPTEEGFEGFECSFQKSETEQTSTADRLIDRTNTEPSRAGAKALVTNHGPLSIDSGWYGVACNITKAETLARIWRKWPHGTVYGADGEVVANWPDRDSGTVARIGGAAEL